MVVAVHPWKLVGPWYRTSNVGGVGRPRSSAPIVQKYAASDFANRMTREPQESLKFTVEDFTRRLGLDPDMVVEPETLKDGEQPFKLFLDIHSRFYTVVAELHCDVPGFPSVSREQVCEAGFVVRRRVPSIPLEAKPLVAKNHATKKMIDTQLCRLEAKASTDEKTVSTSKARRSINVNGIRNLYQQQRRKSLERRRKENLEEFKELVVKYELSLSLQGWVPGEAPNIGRWETLDEEEPAEINESVVAMYPLVADPTDPAHSSLGCSQWFGVIPTSSSDVDGDRGPRFDDNVLYDIRCFVRRHKAGCPKRLNETDCSGELIWSAPTAGYQIASAFDVDGHSHKLTTIKMPNFNDLRDQAALGPAGRGASLSLVTPSGSGMAFTPNGMDMPDEGSSDGPGEICFYFPLLFFIVAFFLFQIILPILLFVLNLWFLLKLKLCLPPSISIDAGLAADLKLEGELQVKMDAGIEVQLGLKADGSPLIVANNESDLKQALAEEVVNGMNLNPSLRAEYVNRLSGDPTMDADGFSDLVVNLGTDFTNDPTDPRIAGQLIEPERGMVYFEKVVRA